MPDDATKRSTWMLVLGIVSVIVIDAGIGALLWSLGLLFNDVESAVPLWFAAANVGFWEWIYIVPLAVFFARRGHQQLRNGLLIGASFATLLTAACWGKMFWR